MLKDLLGKPLNSVISKKLFLLDMDGTIYVDHTVIEGTHDMLKLLRENGKRAMYITNNSSRSVADYVQKLSGLGISASEDDFFTSSMGMSLYLKEHHSHQKVFCMGTRSLIEELSKSGISVTTDPNDGVEVVVLGYDTELTYQKLIDVSRLLKKDLPYLATNPDYVCPVSFGFAPDCGAMAEMLRHSTGKMPLFIGKPDPMILLQAVKKAGFHPKDAVVIGDRLYTDIKSGLNAGITTIAVLSGESTLADIEKNPDKPEYVISSVQTIADLLKTQKPR